MPTLYMVRTPGTKDFRGLSHLLEGRVYDNVAKEDAARLIAAGLAEEFDDASELHVAAVEEFNHLDARRGVPPAKAGAAPATTKTADKGAAGGAYDDWTAEEVHAELTKRNIEGRAGVGKADGIKLLEKDDKAKGKK